MYLHRFFILQFVIEISMVEILVVSKNEDFWAEIYYLVRLRAIVILIFSIFSFLYIYGILSIYRASGVRIFWDEVNWFESLYILEIIVDFLIFGSVFGLFEPTNNVHFNLNFSRRFIIWKKKIILRSRTSTSLTLIEPMTDNKLNFLDTTICL